LIVLFAFLQIELFEPAKVREFADLLYLQEDYASALNEYRRYVFLGDSADDEEEVCGRIIDCLVRLRKFKEALRESDKLAGAGKRDYVKGWVYFVAGDYDSARAYLERASAEYQADAKRVTGISHAYEFNFRTAGDYLAMPEPLPRYKSPALGGILSLFPGGGHFYSGRIGDGIYSLLMTSTVSLVAYYYYERCRQPEHQNEELKFSLSLTAAILFYAGNIYGGINAVKNHNYSVNKAYLERVIEENRVPAGN
jgi:tetratricopeptide (TPR) repeat protein